MKFFTFIVLIFSSGCIFGQSDSRAVQMLDERDSLLFKTGSCETGQQEATRDISAGILKISRRAPTLGKYDRELEQFYSNYLLTSYGIERTTMGCFFLEKYECYYDEMKSAIVRKYGAGFFEKSDSAAIYEFEKFRNLDIESKKKYISINCIYTWTDEKPVYTADLAELQNKIKRRIDVIKLDSSGYKLKGFYAELVINEAGIVTDCQVKSKNFPLDAAEAVREAIIGVGGWKPATLYGNNVKSRTGFSVIF